MEKKRISEIMFTEKLISSLAEARRLANCGAVKWDGRYVTDPQSVVEIDDGETHILTVGKKTITVTK